MSKEIAKDPMTRSAGRPYSRALVLLGISLAALCGCSSEPAWKSQSFSFALPSAPVSAGARTNIVQLRRINISPLFQGRAFTYRTGENSYEHDPYAGFFITPERAIEQPIMAALRAGGAFGSVLDPGSGLKPSLVAEVSVGELYGDFRKAGHPMAALEIHFILYEVSEEGVGRVVLDKVYARQTPMTKAAPAALIKAWDTDLGEIMADINAGLKDLSLP